MRRVFVPEFIAAESHHDPFFGRGVAFAVFQWCLLKARWNDANAPLPRQKVPLKRGQVAIGQVQLAETLGFSRKQIRTAIDWLTENGFFGHQSGHHGTIITINDYDGLTSIKNDEGPAKGPTKGQPRATSLDRVDRQEKTNAALAVNGNTNRPAMNAHDLLARREALMQARRISTANSNKDDVS